MQITYFVHSTSRDNDRGIRSGWQDTPLSDTGIRQAHDLREHLTQTQAHFTAVYTSDLQRALHTARIAFPHTPIITDVRLREMNYGAFNGRSAHHFPADPTHCVHNRFPAGENCLDVARRIRHFLNERLHENPQQHIAIIAHKYPQLALEVLCNGRTWAQAIDADWREHGQWQPGWMYEYQ